MFESAGRPDPEGRASSTDGHDNSPIATALRQVPGAASWLHGPKLLPVAAIAGAAVLIVGPKRSFHIARKAAGVVAIARAVSNTTNKAREIDRASDRLSNRFFRH